MVKFLPYFSTKTAPLNSLSSLKSTFLAMLFLGPQFGIDTVALPTEVGENRRTTGKAFIGSGNTPLFLGTKIIKG